MQRENIRNETIYELTLGCFHSTVSIKRFLNTQQSMPHPLLCVLPILRLGKNKQIINFPNVHDAVLLHAAYTYISYIHFIYRS